MTAERIQRVVECGIQGTRPLLGPGLSIPDGQDAPLLDVDGGPLDSMGVVNLMIAVEGAFEEEFGSPVSLADVLGEPPETSPFRTRAALSAELSRRVDPGGAG